MTQREMELEHELRELGNELADLETGLLIRNGKEDIPAIKRLGREKKDDHR